ncbi:hypothetical protein KKA14_00575 [bacterium]|nr:hypothetical protein [bacterium]
MTKPRQSSSSRMRGSQDSLLLFGRFEEIPACAGMTVKYRQLSKRHAIALRVSLFRLT